MQKLQGCSGHWPKIITHTGINEIVQPRLLHSQRQAQNSSSIVPSGEKKVTMT